jgi:hypothetical protein
MKHAFMVSSAINTTIGKFSNEQRLEQTLATLNSIRTKVPDAYIMVIECSAFTLTREQKDILSNNSNILLSFDNDLHVKEMYEENMKLANWDIVKSYTEIYCFLSAFNVAKENGYFNGMDRIHKLSGRYVLTDKFDINAYADENFKNRIITSRRYLSQFDPDLVDNIPFCYMTRLWSWPNVLTRQVHESYKNSLKFLIDTVMARKPTKLDIEHLLYRYLPSDLVTSVMELGVEGYISTMPEEAGVGTIQD